MRVYLAGPMSHVPYFNRPAFDAAADKLRSEGHEVYSPVDHDIRVYGEAMFDNPSGDPEKAKEQGFDLRMAMADNCKFICLHAEAIALLPGWEYSAGADAEVALADALNLKIIELEPELEAA